MRRTGFFLMRQDRAVGFRNIWTYLGVETQESSCLEGRSRRGGGENRLPRLFRLNGGEGGGKKNPATSTVREGLLQREEREKVPHRPSEGRAA